MDPVVEPSDINPQRPKIREPRRPTSPDGLLVIDKPSEMTSHDVVSRLRRLCGTRAVGHGGTLDPMATGLLVCGIGKGTKLLTYISGSAKTYDATIRLGIGTDTDDAEGVPISTPGFPAVAARVLPEQVGEFTGAGCPQVAPSEPQDITATIKAAIEKLTGEIQQTPTTVSAIKVNGERAYDLARAGKEVKLKPRSVTISSFMIHNITTSAFNGIPVVDIDVSVTVSSGTYVRALARDLGAILGSAGHLTKLRRTWIGGAFGAGFNINDATPLAELAARGDKALATNDYLPTMPLAEAAARFLPIRQLTASETNAVLFGQFIAPSPNDYPTAAINPAGDLVALLQNAKQKGQKRARPITVLAEPRRQTPGSVVTFGSFDGVQRGHQALLAAVTGIATQRGLKSVALTFEPHPAIFHASRPGLLLIQGINDKVKTLQHQNLDVVEVIEYTKEFAAQSPAEFIYQHLVAKHNAKVIVLGSDARFGRKREGDLALLRALGLEYGFEVVEFADVGISPSGERWSSSAVRQAISAGDMPTANEILGRAHSISGIVVHGNHRGRELGFPTANLADIIGFIPADGVYAGWLTIQNSSDEQIRPNEPPKANPVETNPKWPAAISIGTNPTFSDVQDRRVEAYVLDRTDLDLYGQNVKLEFITRVRPTEKFNSIEELIAQMEKDVAEIRALTLK